MDSFFDTPPHPVYADPTTPAPRQKPKKTFKQKKCPPRSPSLDLHYDGEEVSSSASGRSCQKWTTQEPHSHNKTNENFPNRGVGDHPFCRNPDDDPRGPWCYTTDPGLRWEYCDNSAEPCDECKFSNGDCGDLECWDDDLMAEGKIKILKLRVIQSSKFAVWVTSYILVFHIMNYVFLIRYE